MENQKERRFNPAPVMRVEGETRKIEGNAALFDTVADLGWMTEDIAPGAFDDVLNDDVRALFNHDPNYCLARSKGGAGTLKLSAKVDGLYYSFEYDETHPDHVKVGKGLERGDITQSSFAFTIQDDEWSKRDGKDHRRILKVKELFDVSPVTYPAYTDTSVALRTKPEEKPEENTTPKLNVRQKQHIINKNNENK